MLQFDTVNSGNRKYYPSLDLLKFICSLLIVVHHYQMAFNLWFEGRLNFNNGYFYFGFLVELFFMVSGFLMENSIQKYPYADFGTTIKKKYLRFFPMCFISITAYTLFQWVNYFLSGEFFNNNQVISFWNYFMSSLLLSKGWGIDIHRPANSSIWYINILLICYIWHFVLNKVAKRINVPIIYFYIGMVILGLNLYGKGISFAFLDDDCATGYITTFLGMILYRIIRDYRKAARKISAAFLIIIAIVAAVMLKTDNWNIFKESQRLFLIFALYPPILVLLASSKMLNKQGFMKGIPRYLGKLSYEMYLWHFPLLVLMNVILIITSFPIVHGYKTMALFEVVVILFSVVMCNIVEPWTDSVVHKLI